MSSYNIIVIHICRAGFKIRDDRKAAEKEAMQPHARKRKEKELSDEDFSDAREGNGSEAESEDDGELAAKIAAQEKQLEALMSRKKVVQAPAAVINASRAILPTAKGSRRGADVRARGGEDVPAAARRGRGKPMPDLREDSGSDDDKEEDNEEEDDRRPAQRTRPAVRRGKPMPDLREAEDLGSDDEEEEVDRRPAPKPQRTGPAVESDEPAQPYMTYMLNPRAQSVHVRADYVLPCKVGSNLNQRDLDIEFVEVLARMFLDDGRSVFTQPVALLIAEETVANHI